MLRLKEAVKKYFPKELILKSSKIDFKDKWKSKGGILFSRMWGKKKSHIDFMETDCAYYFDRREYYLKSMRRNVIPQSLFMVILILLLDTFYFKSIYIVVCSIPIIFILMSIVYFLNLRLNKKLTNIIRIDKRWIRTKEIEGDKNTIVGTIPTGETYSFIYQIEINLKRDSEAKVKFKGQKDIKNVFMNLIGEIEFNFEYRFEK